MLLIQDDLFSEIKEMGSKIVGKKYIAIHLSPEEVLEYWKWWGEKKTLTYLTSLTKHYKLND